MPDVIFSSVFIGFYTNFRLCITSTRKVLWSSYAFFLRKLWCTIGLVSNSESFSNEIEARKYDAKRQLCRFYSLRTKKWQQKSYLAYDVNRLSYFLGSLFHVQLAKILKVCLVLEQRKVISIPKEKREVRWPNMLNLHPIIYWAPGKNHVFSLWTVRCIQHKIILASKNFITPAVAVVTSPLSTI